MKFNQELITKARKGEIAILNDGSLEELNMVQNEVLSGKLYNPGNFKYYWIDRDRFWSVAQSAPYSPPAHSVKDFFINSTNKEMGELKKYGLEWLEEKKDQPRTYKVTRHQMKEIWELCDNQPYKEFLHKFAENRFWVFDDEIKLSIGEVGELLSAFSNFPVPYPEKLRSIFPEYFYIPEGEPVLVRQDDCMNWVIRISNGTGGAYSMGYLSGKSEEWKQIIPFTKNPPK